MNLNKNNSEKVNLDQLLGKLQKEDNNYSNLCKALKLIYWILIPLYTLMAILTYFETKEINDLIGGLLFVVSFLIFALVMGNFQKEYKNADYSLPTLSMLKKAVQRYQPFRAKSIWAFVAFFVMDAGFCMSSNFSSRAIEFQVYIIGLFFAAVAVGLIIWYFKYKPLRDNALAIIAEIEGE